MTTKPSKNILLPQDRFTTTTEKPLVDDEETLDKLVDLVDLVLDQEEEQDPKFQVFLRLSPVPESLVKGYDFKMLNK